MNKYKALAVTALSFLLFLSLTVTAQKTKIDNKTYTGTYGPVSRAIAKSYPASVLMWEIDAESGNRMSAQFSGVVVSKDGEVMSAAHVVTPGKTYKVMFPDGKECTAKGLGRISIPPTFMLPDAAMLKIVDKGSWPFAQMGWSSALSVGQPCISIAYPESLEQRKPQIRFGRITVLKNKHGFLESSCIMEPGDSGGPLFDLLGRVIGIHSGIEVSENVNYEVPVDTYRKYRSALHKPVSFEMLPVVTDVVVKDTLASSVRTLMSGIPPQNKLLALNKQVDLSCLKIKSVINGNEQQIYGTLISLKELNVKSPLNGNPVVVSKSSMIGTDPIILLPNGEFVKARVLARTSVSDLVLLLPSKKIGTGISLKLPEKDSITFSDLGKFILSPTPDSMYRTGIIGSMWLNLPKITSYGYMGASTAIKDDKLVFASVNPGSAAEIGGLKAGDQVIAVDGHHVEDPLDFIKALQKYRAGDSTTISLTRASENLDKTIILGYPPQRKSDHPAELFQGGKSIRRDGFDNVFVHDTKLQPKECGGPVFDFDGQFRGINIARISRTSSVAIPVKTIHKFLTETLGKQGM